jgi:prepilin-type N-terminal cleavage/methylation domain-containing protein
MNHSLSSQKGFTIIESLVAISIIVAVIIGTTGAVQKGLASYQFSKDQITAFYLAQEGFEQIRNIRDNNVLNERDWLAGLAQTSSDACWFGELCAVEPAVTSAATRCAVGGCDPLREDTDTGWYGYNASWPVTRFTRQITLSQVNSAEITVAVTVSWNQGGASRSFEARENLLNWH